MVALNERLYCSAKTLFESKNALLLSKFPLTFIEEVIKHTACTQTTYNIHREAVMQGGGTVSQTGSTQLNSSSSNTGAYIFQGYPSGNFLKQVSNINF